MAMDAYLKIEGVEGEATAKDFQNQIDLYSFSWGVSNPANAGMGTGLGAGRATLSSFNLMKKTDKASPGLFQACCSGKHFEKATVSMRKAGGEQVVFLKYEFSTIFIESVQWSGSSGGDDVPTESLSFAFEKVDIEYFPQAAKGSTEGKVAASWDTTAISK